jgi:hypothetical protein
MISAVGVVEGKVLVNVQVGAMEWLTEMRCLYILFLLFLLFVVVAEEPCVAKKSGWAFL